MEKANKMDSIQNLYRPTKYFNKINQVIGFESRWGRQQIQGVAAMQPFIVFFNVKKIARINDRGMKLLGLILWDDGDPGLFSYTFPVTYLPRKLLSISTPAWNACVDGLLTTPS